MEKKYKIFDLYIVTIDEKRFICEQKSLREFEEVLTGKNIKFDENEPIKNISKHVEKMIIHYPLLEWGNPVPPKPILLTKNDILNEYINFNKLSTESDYYQEKTDLASIIDDIVEQPDTFYKLIGESLTPEEREYIKSLLPKTCDTCANFCCRVEQVDKPINDCVGWENNRIIGQYKVLRLNRKSK